MKAYDAARLLGMPAADEYGGILGKVIGFTTDVFGNVKSIVVAGTAGEAEEYSMEMIEVKGEGVTVLSYFSVEFRRLERVYWAAHKRFSALIKLKEAGEVRAEIAEKVYEQFLSSYEKLKSKAEALAERLETRLQELESAIERLEEIKLHVKIQMEAGDLTAEQGGAALKELNAVYDRLGAEKEILSRYLEKVKEMLSGEEAPSVVRVSF